MNLPALCFYYVLWIYQELILLNLNDIEHHKNYNNGCMGIIF
jgi:hypothetical protein